MLYFIVMSINVLLKSVNMQAYNSIAHMDDLNELWSRAPAMDLSVYNTTYMYDYYHALYSIATAVVDATFE